MHPLLSVTHSISDKELSSMEKGYHINPETLLFPPFAYHGCSGLDLAECMFLSQAVAVLLSARAAGRGWDTPHRTWPEKLLSMASEIAGCDTSQGKKLTNVYMVL